MIIAKIKLQRLDFSVVASEDCKQREIFNFLAL